jgi:hypothetical protein
MLPGYVKGVQDEALTTAEDVDKKAAQVIHALIRHAEDSIKGDPFSDENIGYSCDIIAAKEV